MRAAGPAAGTALSFNKLCTRSLYPVASGFFAEVIQQTHSLRASGVMSFHAASAAGTARAFFRSAGSLCTAFLVKALLFGFFIL